MNYWLKNETLRRCLFPLAFVCIFIVWRLAEHGVRSVWVYLLLMVGVICLALDRVFKPWEHDRMRKRQERDRGLEDNRINKGLAGRRKSGIHMGWGGNLLGCQAVVFCQ